MILDVPLQGKKIAVVVESQYIPPELQIYKERFSKYGATVDFVSRLWDNPSLNFYSTVEPGVVDKIEELTVSKDLDNVNLDEYAAVIFSANYTSVKLRWTEREDIDASNAGEIIRNTPAAYFARKAMQNPKVIKGFACHSLWLLTPSPDILAGRKVICNKVVLADVLNAGAIYTQNPAEVQIDYDKQIVVDGDLVTSNSWHASQEMVDTIRDLILSRPDAQRTTAEKLFDSLQERFDLIPDSVSKVARPVAKAASQLLDGSLDVAAEVKRITGIELNLSKSESHKPILLVGSKFGTWASELTLVAATLLKVGYKVKIATEDGSPPHFLSPSLNPEFLDGAWRWPVVSPEERDLGLRFLNPNCQENLLLRNEHILDLSCLAKPPQVGDYFKDRTLLNKYREELEKTISLAEDYDALIIAGGSGAIPGLMFDRGFQGLILSFYDLGKPIMAQCNGGLALAQTVDPNTSRSILFGRAVTTHSWLDEFQQGWGWTHTFSQDTQQFWVDGKFDLERYASEEEWLTPGSGGNPLIDSEGLFKNAAGPGGVFFSPAGSAYSVVVDGKLITCRTTPDGYPGVLALMAMLDGKQPFKGRFFIDRDECGRDHF